MNATTIWGRFKRYHRRIDDVGLAVDISRMNLPDSFLRDMRDPMQRAFDEMAALEAGAVANPDESRRVGHYWLRAPQLAPDNPTRSAIIDTLSAVKRFASDVRRGAIVGPTGEAFAHQIVIGIGGSALGPQWIADALGSPNDPWQPYFCDNTDPDGIDRVLAAVEPHLPRTLTLVVSKSGGTIETRNTMLEVQHAYQRAACPFAPCAVAVTQNGSALDRQAADDGWLRRFPMWDWVGGRTSVFSAVGILPAALQGLDVDALLDGAAACDRHTRQPDAADNAAALMALSWYHAGKGRGDKNMVVLPYKDRLLLLGRYLQQLIMESLGKRLDRDGREVCQGLTVFGNKGSTDQHAYVQQLRDGRDDFFVTFVEVLHDRPGHSIEVEPDVTTGDCLHGFMLGTRSALSDRGRQSITITLDTLSERSLGALIALFERTVGFYASLINVNAYHQPGVEAGKTAAAEVIELQRRILRVMRQDPDRPRTADEWADATGDAERTDIVFAVLEHLAANNRVKAHRRPAETRWSTRYSL